MRNKVDINRDFLNKNQKIRFFSFKSDFLDLNQTLRFKLLFLSNVSHLLDKLLLVIVVRH